MTSQMKPDAQIITCQECGKECAQLEFIHGLNLCDHLALDSIALKMAKEQNTIY